MISKYSIGRSYNNDIVIKDSTGGVSRLHAYLEFDGISYFITDLESANGTFVNDVRIPSNLRRKVTPNDRITFAQKAILEWNAFIKAQGKQHPKFHTNSSKRTFLYFLFGFLLLILIISGYFIIRRSIHSISPEQLVKRYEKGIVLICSVYYVNFILRDGTTAYIGMDKESKHYSISVNKYELDPVMSFGTGFILTDDGKIVTNRHVGYSWQEMLDFLTSSYPEISSADFDLVFLGAVGNNTQLTLNDKVDNISLLRTNFTECKLIKKHSDENVDLAIIQTKFGNMIKGCKKISLNNIARKNSDKVGDKAYLLGYPAGLSGSLVSRDSGSKAICLSFLEGSISKTANKFDIQYSIPSGSGSSGSPVLNQKGKIIAINYSTIPVQGGLMNYGIKSGYIFDLLP